MVVASAGTITTGVVDSLADVADVAQEHGLWLHVDGAYGGFFQLTSRGRAAFRGVERADSITLDPHKGMFLPYGTGCLLARDGAALREAHELQAHYLPPPSADPGLPDFASYSPELTRDFRGLRMWLPLHLHGVDLFEDALNEKLDLASYVHACLTEMPDLDLPWPPELSLVAFKPRDGRLDAEDCWRVSTAPVGSGSRRLRCAATRTCECASCPTARAASGCARRWTSSPGSRVTLSHG
jgi:aromatic-L-amino-acid decarboxylase